MYIKIVIHETSYVKRIIYEILQCYLETYSMECINYRSVYDNSYESSSVARIR